MQNSEVAHADETSWRRAGQRIWLWAALSATACCYRIDPTRARPAAKALLGSFDGLLICDLYSVYDFIDPLHALNQLTAGTPWLPATASP